MFIAAGAAINFIKIHTYTRGGGYSTVNKTETETAREEKLQHEHTLKGVRNFSQLLLLRSIYCNHHNNS